MAVLRKMAKDTIVAAVNDFFVKMDKNEDVFDLKFKLTDDMAEATIELFCIKRSRAPDVTRKLEYRNGTIMIDATQPEPDPVEQDPMKQPA